MAVVYKSNVLHTVWLNVCSNATDNGDVGLVPFLVSGAQPHIPHHSGECPKQ